MNAVPDDVIELVHSAATATTPHGHDLGVVRDRWRARRRRTAVIAAAAAFLAVLAGVGVPVVAKWTIGRSRSATAPPVPAERLLLTINFPGLLSEEAGQAYRDAPRAFEIFPDKTVVQHQLPKNWGRSIGLPDGRLVGVAWPSHELSVVRPGGGVDMTRVVGANRTLPVDATASEVYFYELGQAIVAHDLATGRERQIFKVEGDGRPIGMNALHAGLIATFRTHGPEGSSVSQPDCVISVIELAGLRQRGTWSIPDCTTVWDAAFSPDLKLLAVQHLSTSIGSPKEITRVVTIFDVANGRALTSRQIDRAVSPSGDRAMRWASAMAWADARTLMIGRIQTSKPVERFEQLAAFLEVFKVTVP